MIHFHKKNYKIGLDIDDVCCNFLGGYSKYTEGKYIDFKHFFFSYVAHRLLPDVGEEFWMGLEPKFDPNELPFLPTCYISTRSFDKRISENWLEKNGFPCMPVIHTHMGTKVDACKKLGVNIFVDDFIKNFSELHAAGVETFLYDCDHNRQFDVGDYRIKDICEVPKKIMNLNL